MVKNICDEEKVDGEGNLISEIDKNLDVGEVESDLDDVEIEYEAWDDELSDVHSIDHLSEGEDELMEVRKGIIAKTGCEKK